MVIALLCPVLSFVPEDLASSMIEHGLAQKDERRADRLGAEQESWFYSQNRSLCVCVCGRNRGHFPAEETLVYVLAGEAVQESWLKNREGKQRWRCV